MNRQQKELYLSEKMNLLNVQENPCLAPLTEAAENIKVQIQLKNNKWKIDKQKKGNKDKELGELKCVETPCRALR